MGKRGHSTFSLSSEGKKDEKVECPLFLAGLEPGLAFERIIERFQGRGK
jgi:hypothetical protein